MSTDLSQKGYTHKQVRDVLHMKHGSRKIRFRYFLLDKNDNELADISHLVLSGSIEQSAFSDIKRTGKFKLKDDVYISNKEEKKINWYADRIQVFVDFKVPPWMQKGKEEWINYSLGVFLVSTPTRQEEGKSIYREVEAYDKLLILKEDKVTERYTIKKDTSYYSAMLSVLGSTGEVKFNIENSEKLLNTDKEYDPGTEKLQILNDLASDLNFTPMWVDEYGFFRSNQYVSPQEKSSDYTYVDDDMSITQNGMEEELDLFDLPNTFTITVSSPDEDINLSSTAENTNINHPRSIPNLGRRVVRFEEKENIADQASLDAYVERLAFEASQVYGRVKFNTAIMPFHSYSNVLRVKNKTLGIDDKYAEVNWSMSLESGSMMQHECRRVVSLI